MQRLRIKFSRGKEVKFISHLDLERLWQRAFTRAKIPIAYSQGFNPRPRMSLAVPLALGITSEAELMDIFCTKPVSPHEFNDAVSKQLPLGIQILQVYQVPLELLSLQSQVRYVEYKVEVESEKTQKDIKSAICNLLSLKSLSWHHQRDTGIRTYDLRALIDDIRLTDWRDGSCVLIMRLRCDSSGAGRPEQVSAALGFILYPQSIHRTKLILEAKQVR